MAKVILDTEHKTIVSENKEVDFIKAVLNRGCKLSQYFEQYCNINDYTVRAYDKNEEEKKPNTDGATKETILAFIKAHGTDKDYKEFEKLLTETKKEIRRIKKGTKKNPKYEDVEKEVKVHNFFKVKKQFYEKYKDFTTEDGRTIKEYFKIQAKDDKENK